MHLKAYRFSVAWTRIAPNGGTDWNEEGFAYYDTLVDALLEAGIEPYVTLYHWDLPQALEEKGGWRSEETARALQAMPQRWQSTSKAGYISGSPSTSLPAS